MLTTDVDQNLHGSNPLIALARRARRIPTLPVIIVTSIGIIVVSAIIGGVLSIGIARVFPHADLDGRPLSGTVLPAIRFALILTASFAPIFLLLWGWLRWYEGRAFATIGFPARNAVRRYVRGFAGGMVFFLLSVGVLYLLGGIEVVESDPSVTGLSAVGGVVLVLAGWVVQGAGEEVLCRGWLLQAVGVRTRIPTGIIASALVFSLLHGLNPDIGIVPLLNIALVGVFLALYALREGSLWGVSGWHAAWNWVQGNIMGLQVSGTAPQGGSLFSFGTTTPDILSGGPFGPEGGLIVTIILLAGIFYFLRLNRPDFTTPSPLPEPVSSPQA